MAAISATRRCAHRRTGALIQIKLSDGAQDSPIRAHAATARDPASSPDPSRACPPVSRAPPHPVRPAVPGVRAAAPRAAVRRTRRVRGSVDLLAYQPDEFLLFHRMQVVPLANRVMGAAAALERATWSVGADVARAKVGGCRVERIDRSQRVVGVRLTKRACSPSATRYAGSGVCHHGCLLSGGHLRRSVGRALIWISDARSAASSDQVAPVSCWRTISAMWRRPRRGSLPTTV